MVLSGVDELFRSVRLGYSVSPLHSQSNGRFSIRGAVASDLPNVERLMEISTSSRFTQCRRWLYRIFPARFVIVVQEQQGEVLVAADIYRLRHCDGFGWALHEELIVVHPEWRKRGLSTMVRNHALNYFREYPVPFITSIIYSSNYASLRGALRAGWKIQSTESAPNNKAPDRKKHLLVYLNKAPWTADSL